MSNGTGGNNNKATWNKRCEHLKYTSNNFYNIIFCSCVIVTATTQNIILFNQIKTIKKISTETQTIEAKHTHSPNKNISFDAI